MAGRSFDALVSEAEAAPINGWDFRWLEGRAIEERPSWHYFDLVAERAANAAAMADLQTGTASLVADLPGLPALTVATEGYEPNLVGARAALEPRRAHLVHTDEERPAVPFASSTFDLVVSRHPVRTWWGEIARILRADGTYLSQQVGPHSLRDLSEQLMGPLPPGSKRDPAFAVASAEANGLEVMDLRSERPRTVFYDIGAVVYFLRLVVWIVPDFTVDRYRRELGRLHERIEHDGAFETTASRFLIEARKPR
jgi:SAM-dependent methyltransferase